MNVSTFRAFKRAISQIDKDRSDPSSPSSRSCRSRSLVRKWRVKYRSVAFLSCQLSLVLPLLGQEDRDAAEGAPEADSDRTGLVVPSGILTTENFTRFCGSGEGSQS